MSKVQGEVTFRRKGQKRVRLDITEYYRYNIEVNCMYNFIIAGVGKKNICCFILEEQLYYITKLAFLYMNNIYSYLHCISKLREAANAY